MSGHLSGVQAIVQCTLGHSCLYVHCYAHRLNLVLVDTARGNNDVNTELAQKRDIEMHTHKRRTSRLPARLTDGIVLSSTGSRDTDSEASFEIMFRKLF